MTAPGPRKFTVGQVMTVLVGSSGRMFCTWGELLDVLGWLLQDVPLVDAVDGAIERARAGVQRQHPDLVAYSAPPARSSDSHVLAWLADIEGRHAPLLELEPIVEPVAEEVSPE